MRRVERSSGGLPARRSRPSLTGGICVGASRRRSEGCASVFTHGRRTFSLRLSGDRGTRLSTRPLRRYDRIPIHRAAIPCSPPDRSPLEPRARRAAGTSPQRSIATRMLLKAARRLAKLKPVCYFTGVRIFACIAFCGPAPGSSSLCRRKPFDRPARSAPPTTRKLSDLLMLDELLL